MAKIRKADSFLSRNISAVHLFIGATLVLPAYLFQQNLLVRMAQVLLFAWLATVNGKRIKWNYFIIMVSSITFFHTLNPFGEVIFSLGPYTMTRGALRGGLFRGVTIVGLVFLSLFSIRPDLKLPGKLGGLLGQVFYYFERVFEGKKKIRVKAIIESLDEILWDLFVPGETVEPAYIEGTRTTKYGWLFLGALIGANWFLVFYRVPLTIL